MTAPVPLTIGNYRADASVVETFGVDPAVLVRKTGKARILVQSLAPAPLTQCRHLVRFSIGLKSVADLQADLQADLAHALRRLD